ncbi:MAG: aminopeptidase P family protein, partial [Erysipelotrichaceae bacterium]|nr:aminopeptidase P family protein [Erysipelotrichaceae bacterium]
MKRRELDQLIISDPLSIRYLTQIYVEPFERLWALLLSKDGKACLFANNLFVLPENELETVWYSDSEDSIGKITERIIPGRLGIDKMWPARFLIPLQERLNDTVTVLGSDCVDDCRAIKDHDEIRRMKEASRINDIVMETASRYVREGMSEKEVAGFIRNEYLKYGCQGVSFDPIVS